jgi:hypothetical protein
MAQEGQAIWTQGAFRAEGTPPLPPGIPISRSLEEAWYGGPLPGGGHHVSPLAVEPLDRKKAIA